MSAREVTQFSMFEALSFAKALQPPKTPREQYLADFAAHVAKLGDDAFKPSGGIDNIQRVRVVQNGDVVSYEYGLKLPLNILEQKRREADRERRMKEVLAKAEELKNNPKKYDEFVRKVVAGILGRAAAELLLASSAAKRSMAQVARRVAPAAKKTGSRLSKNEAYERAIQQDRRQRIEAAKKGPKSLKSEGTVTA